MSAAILRADISPPLPRGLIIELFTPRDASGEFDEAAFERLVAWTAPHADGLLLAGPEAGGGPEVEPAVRARMLHLAAAKASGPLFMFITRPTKAQTVECLDAVLTGGEADRVVLVDAPLLVRSNRGLPEWLFWLGEHTGRPVVIYNHPGLAARAEWRGRMNVRTSVLKKSVQEVGDFCGLFFRGDDARLMNYHEAARHRPGFRVYDASEARFLDRPGSSGLLSVRANLLPAAFSLATRAAIRLDNPAPPAAVLAAGRSIRRLGEVMDLRGGAFLRSGLAALGVLPAGPGDSPSEETSRLLQELSLLPPARS